MSVEEEFYIYIYRDIMQAIDKEWSCYVIIHSCTKLIRPFCLVIQSIDARQICHFFLYEIYRRFI